MANYVIITNNPAVFDSYGEVVQCVSGGVEEVFTAVRDAIHLGALLISHPLAGSLKPNESPYKSVVLSTSRGQMDMASLMTIEDATATLRKLPVKKRHYSQQILEDFSVIDLDLIQSAMQSLPPVYHKH